ncbi:MAG: B12-binding domain-containing radical SAM protein [bacterium]
MKGTMAKRIVLGFPPPANPTYIPLGLASLVSYLKIRIPGLEVFAYDLNMLAWQKLPEGNDGGARAFRFMQGNGEPFFQETWYRHHRPAFDDLYQTLLRWRDEAKRYLQSGECPDSLRTFLEAAASLILSHEPEVIGFSVMFLDQLVFALALARYIRTPGKGELWSMAGRPASIILGGAAMSAVCVEDLWPACPFLDAVHTGEGEESLALLCEGAPLDEIPGVKTPFTGRGAQPQGIIPLLPSSLPVPDFSQFRLENYATPVPVLPVAFSRDCKWRRCRFCAHNFSFNGYREKLIAQFVDELEFFMKRYGVRYFYLVDQYIAAKSLEALSDEIIKRGLSLSFSVMGRPVEEYTAERLDKAAAAGCSWISWGVETGSQRLLKLVRKGTRSETIARVLQNSHRAGIVNTMMLIFGLPTSTEGDLQETFRFIEDVYPEVDTFTASSFVLFQGTDFARQARQFHLLITGRQELFRLGEHPVHSTRLTFMQKDSSGSLLPPIGPTEVSRWMQRRSWLGEIPLLETLCCEHFLIYSVLRRAAPQITPTHPVREKAA